MSKEVTGTSLVESCSVGINFKRLDWLFSYRPCVFIVSSRKLNDSFDIAFLERFVFELGDDCFEAKGGDSIRSGSFSLSKIGLNSSE